MPLSDAQDLLQRHLSIVSRSAGRSGYYGGGGCGGLEVFAFLAFLLALLDLFLDLNDMKDDMEGTMARRTRRAYFRSPAGCKLIFKGEGEVRLQVAMSDVNVEEGVWAAGKLAEGVLKAVTTTPTCGHAHMCHAAVAAATKGPLAATLTTMAGEWLEKWPPLSGSRMGRVTLHAVTTLTCPAIHDACDTGDGDPGTPTTPTQHPPNNNV